MSKKRANLASKTSPEPLKRPKISILGVMVNDISEEEAVSTIIGLATDGKKGHMIATVNSEFVMLARKSENFAKILRNTDLNLPDGAGIVLSKLILGGKVANRVTGTDLIEKLSSKIADKPITVGFLGGFSSVAKKVAERQEAKFPGLRAYYFAPGDSEPRPDLRLKKAILAVGGVDILFVAYGMGRQEFWIEANRNVLKVGVFIGVGGAFDYLSGVKRRAPVSMRKIGLEWLWRLAMEPQRIWRMRVLPVFALLVLVQFFQKSRFFKGN